MTEQELLKKIGTLTTPEHLLECAKAYADARESKEIAELRDQLRIETDLKKVYSKACVESGKVIEARDTEIAELKASLSQAQQMYTDLLVGTTDAINAKEAEIKRLREFVQQCQKSPEKLVKMNWFEDGSFDYCDLVPLQEAAASAISPAPVTYHPDILTKILALPDDTSSAYIKALIHDQIKLK